MTTKITSGCDGPPSFRHSNGTARVRYVDGNTKDQTTTAKAGADKDSDLLTVSQGASETNKQRKQSK